MEYVFMPCFSIEPNKISTFNKVFYKYADSGQLKSHHDLKRRVSKQPKAITDKNEVQKAFHGFELSDNAFRTLKRKINWLNYMAKNRTVKTYSGKTIYNFKCAFLTFTLPSKQEQPTLEITQKYFNQLLTELRQRTKMENYVWRLEFQKNGNVHYHIVTDTYIDYFFALKVWNRILAKGPYIQKFKSKFEHLTLSEYRDVVDPDHKREYQKVAQSYAKGKQSKWENPPSVDVKSVKSGASISFYISKYFAKDSNENPIKNEHDTAENSESIRLWYCSRSLSKLKSVCDFCEAVDFSAQTIVEGLKQVRKVVFRYATVFYFEIAKLPSFCKKELSLILRHYAYSEGYKPSK